MATKIIGQGPATPTSHRSAATVHGHALEVLKELTTESDKVFAVASAGRHLCAASPHNSEGSVFAVIEDLAGDATLLHSLRPLINELAQAAGSDYVEGQSHE